MPVILRGGPLGSGVQAGQAQGPQLLAAAQKQQEFDLRREMLAQAMEQEQVDATSVGEMAQVSSGGILPEVAGASVAGQAGAMAAGAALGVPPPQSMYGLDKDAAVLPQADIVLQRAIDRGASKEVLAALGEDIASFKAEIIEQADTAKTVQLLTEWGQVYPEQQQFVDIATGLAGQVPAKDLLREALKGIADSNAQQSEMMSRQAFLVDSRARREALNDPNHPFRQELLASGIDPFEVDEIVQNIQKKRLIREVERGFDMQQGQGQPEPAPKPELTKTETVSQYLDAARRGLITFDEAQAALEQLGIDTGAEVDSIMGRVDAEPEAAGPSIFDLNKSERQKARGQSVKDIFSGKGRYTSAGRARSRASVKSRDEAKGPVREPVPKRESYKPTTKEGESAVVKDGNVWRIEKDGQKSSTSWTSEEEAKTEMESRGSRSERRSKRRRR